MSIYHQSNKTSMCVNDCTKDKNNHSSIRVVTPIHDEQSAKDIYNHL